MYVLCFEEYNAELKLMWNEFEVDTIVRSSVFWLAQGIKKKVTKFRDSNPSN